MSALASWRRRVLVRRLDACYRERMRLAALSTDLEDEIRRLDEARLARRADLEPPRPRPAPRVDGEPVRVARTLREAFGDGARLEGPSDPPRPLVLSVAALVAVVALAAALYALGVL